jgi:ubiquitin carboxyl-terminal hydrolase 9/24
VSQHVVVLFSQWSLHFVVEQTNREENLMNIDCQIRGKNDIHEALSTMCEVEYMEGNNKVFCDRCKKNTDTVLKTAISALPDMLILSLKRFDLDYNTFETVKLNSRCEFGEMLNMKRYTLQGVEALEKAGLAAETADSTPMDTDEDNSESLPIDPLSSLPDEDYEYKLAGVLVHAGVAQGGHYYSFIKDRSPGIDADKWYRFDDEDVTPFDPSSIEVECFGGKVKKETKWPNGQVHTVESEQFANALMLFYEKVTPAKKPEKEPEGGKEQFMPPHVEKASGYDVFEPDVRRSNATHRWQTFLFDSEFQSFLRGLLGICHRTSTDKDRVAMSPKSSPRQRSDASWEGPVIEMLLSFFFDVLLYSAQKESVNDWVGMLCEILIRDGELAKRFVHELAERTHAVSSNWLRTYLTDCPEREARFSAARVFSAGIQSCSAFTDEQDSLRKWATAWESQTNELPHGRAYPVRLEGRCQELELLTGIRSGRASAVGIILSFLARLLEAASRTWRYNSDLFFLIRELANARPEYGGILLREAMLSAEFPARLICLVCRDRTQSVLRTAFPGATVSFAAAETQSRAETNPSAHLMPMGSGQLMGASDRNSRSAASGSPGGPDFLTLFEAFGCLLGVKGVMLAPLVYETEEAVRGRQHFVLTKRAADALTLIFQESCSVPEAGMGQREIELYLQRTGVDSASVSPQKIIDILAKYTADGSGSKGSNLLSVDGFLAYYRDTAQSNENRVSR